MKRDQQKLMEDPAVKQAIRTLVAKGVTPETFEDVYRHYDRIKNPKTEKSFEEVFGLI